MSLNQIQRLIIYMRNLSIIEKDWKQIVGKVKKLGSGAFGKVYVTDDSQSGNKFVYKIFTNSKNNNKNVDLFYSFNDYYEELGENRYMYDKDFLKFIKNNNLCYGL